MSKERRMLSNVARVIGVVALLWFAAFVVISASVQRAIVQNRSVSSQLQAANKQIRILQEENKGREK
uniref:Uncharacterized protein n=1 Tax=viral metagenome TaxID=1070528 RepID=A0A6M3JFW0_9ZZZZ